jgi:hypothetical protein
MEREVLDWNKIWTRVRERKIRLFFGKTPNRPGT